MLFRVSAVLMVKMHEKSILHTAGKQIYIKCLMLNMVNKWCLHHTTHTDTEERREDEKLFRYSTQYNLRTRILQRWRVVKLFGISGCMFTSVQSSLTQVRKDDIPWMMKWDETNKTWARVTSGREAKRDKQTEDGERLVAVDEGKKKEWTFS